MDKTEIFRLACQQLEDMGGGSGAQFSGVVCAPDGTHWSVYISQSSCALLGDDDEEYEWEQVDARPYEALERSRRLMPEYWANTLAQRLPGGAGSLVTSVANNPERLDQALQHALWERYDAPELAPNCTAYRTYDVRGIMGLTDLTKVGESIQVTLDDRKNTGRVSATLNWSRNDGERANFCVLILGQHEGSEVAFTFHPGDPIRPSEVEGQAGQVITAGEAIALGLRWAKNVG